MPGELKVVYFVNSGSEANDLALLMARAYTGSYDVIALRNGYHGGSQSTMGLTSHHTWKFNVPHGFGVQHAILPDLYRGPHGKDDPEAGRKYAEDVKSLIQFGTSGRIAGFIAESIQGVGGTVVFPDGYLEARLRPRPGGRRACASPTRSRRASAGRAPTSGASRRRASCRTSSRWPRASATAARSRPS